MCSTKNHPKNRITKLMIESCENTGWRLLYIMRTLYYVTGIDVSTMYIYTYRNLWSVYRDEETQITSRVYELVFCICILCVSVCVYWAHLIPCAQRRYLWENEFQTKRWYSHTLHTHPNTHTHAVAKDWDNEKRSGWSIFWLSAMRT